MHLEFRFQEYLYDRFTWYHVIFQTGPRDGVGVHVLQKCFIKFWAINKTEVQKIDVEVEVEVSGWLWLD